MVMHHQETSTNGHGQTCPCPPAINHRATSAPRSQGDKKAKPVHHRDKKCPLTDLSLTVLSSFWRWLNTERGASSGTVWKNSARRAQTGREFQKHGQNRANRPVSLSPPHAALPICELPSPRPILAQCFLRSTINHQPATIHRPPRSQHSCTDESSKPAQLSSNATQFDEQIIIGETAKKRIHAHPSE